MPAKNKQQSSKEMGMELLTNGWDFEDTLIIGEPIGVAGNSLIVTKESTANDKGEMIIVCKLA